jgi:hypothetical protein
MPLVDRKHFVPTFDGGDDPVGIGGPDEGFRVRVVLAEEAVDRGLKVSDRAEYAAPEAPFGHLVEQLPTPRGHSQICTARPSSKQFAVWPALDPNLRPLRVKAGLETTELQ